ncbi:MAG: hypothetical protein K2X07_13730 [Caulobacteraceae bacterium]|nr:hypothetical protein [Caulobacteraceae bacterium]
MSMGRTVLAFSAAPVASSVALGAALSASSGADATSWIFGTLAIGVFGLLFTLPATLVGGTLSFLVLKAIGRDSPPWFVGAGATVGLICGALLLSTGGTPDDQREPVWVLLVTTAFAGTVGGAVFGLVRGQSRPKNEASHVL